MARLEALTALWERRVRLEGPADATLLYSAAPPPPPPPSRRPAEEPAPPEPATVWERDDTEPPPADDEAEVARRSAELRRRRVDRRPEPDGPIPAPVPDGPGHRVSDWVSRHDPASLNYPVRERLSHPVPLQDLVLEHGPILDQGTIPPLSLHDASACVGMAVVAAANVLDATTLPPYTDLSRHEFLGVDRARALYARAQELDDVSGTTYPGTSVLAGMKAGQEAGWWDTYLWALRGTRDIAQALLQLHAPVVIGIPWTAGMESPDSAGVIRPTGAAAGGHALAIIGLRLRLSSVLAGPGPYFVLQQSRGPAEGDHGLVYLHHAHLGQLLAGVGEAAVPLPRWGLA